ncbi:uncharacterized protein UMAG_04790 [Mycosarcoma maydis]|uniref:Uncharacterized protein n=1 Tax=Mycosarcoma maydis TaxID=5270 RepID=A0A0D1DS66_MYCMD|nr:uncharacterized protein UMAG_04790 [Ustilago maydis 521]KIS66726.1 hypothetical protein UMAG_04790 [Ustilago maydis 521]|eukprot:XP_011391654.1 hypothetical protein UMAG_04790 [Ustilago maydis 521]
MSVPVPFLRVSWAVKRCRGGEHCHAPGSQALRTHDRVSVSATHEMQRIGNKSHRLAAHGEACDTILGQTSIRAYQVSANPVTRPLDNHARRTMPRRKKLSGSSAYSR